MVFDFTTKSFRILLSAVPRCICPLAYGGPSWSTNFGAPARRARIFPYRSICDQRSSTAGSVVGRFAFIGKSVRGRLSVSFQSAMRDLVIVQKKTGAPAREAGLPHLGLRRSSRRVRLLLADRHLERPLVIAERVVVHPKKQLSAVGGHDR